MNNQNLPSIPNDDYLFNLIPKDDLEIADTLAENKKNQYIDVCKTEALNKYICERSIKQKQEEINDIRSISMINKMTTDKQKQAIIDDDQANTKLLEEKENLTNELGGAKATIKQEELIKKYGKVYLDYMNNKTKDRISIRELRYQLGKLTREKYGDVNNDPCLTNIVLYMAYLNYVEYRKLKGGDIRIKGFKPNHKFSISKDGTYSSIKMDIDIYINIIDSFIDNNCRLKKH